MILDHNPSLHQRTTLAQYRLVNSGFLRCNTIPLVLLRYLPSSYNFFGKSRVYNSFNVIGIVLDIVSYAMTCEERNRRVRADANGYHANTRFK